MLLNQSELFGQDEHVCPGYDVCPIGMCGCRWIGLGTPFASDVKKARLAKPSGRGLISEHPLPGAIRVFYSEANMISSRDLNDIHPAVKRRALAMISACDADGITLLITSTYRDNASQDKLYAQGRGGAVGPVVTNAKGGQSWHNWRLALDIVPIVHGKPCWTTTGDAGRLWRKIGDIGKSCGLEWAGDWKRFPEFPHFQYTGGLTLADLQSGKTIRGDA